MSGWEVVLLELGLPGRTLKPPEVPAAFTSVPSPGDIITRPLGDGPGWKVLRIEHGEAENKLEPAARATIERLGKGHPQMAAYLGPRPVCRIIVQPVYVAHESTGKHMLLGLQWPDYQQGRLSAQPHDQTWTRGHVIHLKATPQITCRIVSLIVDKPTAESWAMVDLRIGRNSLCASSAGIPLKPFAVDHALLEQMKEVGALHMADCGDPDSDTAGLPGVSDPIVPLFDLGVAQPGHEVSLIVTNIEGNEAAFCGALIVEHAYLGGEQ